MPKKDFTASEFYDGVWSRGLRKGRKNFSDLENNAAFIAEFVSLQKDHIILDVGCGTGNLCDRLNQLEFGHVFGTDVSKVAIQTARDRNSTVPFVVMNADILAIRSESVDVCVSFDVAEHIHDIDSYFQEMDRILKRDGVFAFQTPNKFYNFLSETIRWKGFGWRPHHPSLQSYISLNKKLKTAGFENIHFYKRNPLQHFNISRLPRFFIAILKMIPWLKFPHWAQTHFWGIARK